MQTIDNYPFYFIKATAYFEKSYGNKDRLAMNFSASCTLVTQSSRCLRKYLQSLQLINSQDTRQ